MKIIKYVGLVSLGLGVLFLAACAPRLKSHGKQGLPPGQAKKVTGSRPAKHYAPGQVKQRGNKRGHYKR